MNTTHKRWGALAVLLLLSLWALVSCNYPGLRPTSDRMATSAAETVSAQLTELAGLATEEPTAPPLATDTPGATATPTEPPTATLSPTPECVNKVTFVKDVTIPDDTNIAADDDFDKTWRLRNDGTCTWTTDYDLVFQSGNVMGGPASQPLAGAVPPGSEVDLTVSLTAPTSNGTHRGNWMLRDDKDVIFGLGPANDIPFFVQIVVGPTPTPEPAAVYDFVDEYCEANWVSGAGVLSCPGTDTDVEGFVIKVDDAKLENGTTENEPVLFTHPEWVNYGVITGTYPAFEVEDGDHFKAVIGCLWNGAACDVRFQLNYRADGGSLQNFGQWDEAYDGSIRKLDLDLSSLAGKSVEFTLAVQAKDSSSQDWAFWLLPRIVR